ncbi:hypothetical protein [Mycolicibacter sinensis]|uniref:Uncharacterized protein n=1 Tax=Mycolicibacter sinensis (strain JDM601) TaxID=875328 RepID=A0A1A2XXN6_MYCSD|nr:hypothetical protein [Mycolicibacter sinensis]OBI29832.1 hypothetical protein A5710_20780 [Mycolicibacter sinensis]
MNTASASWLGDSLIQMVSPVVAFALGYVAARWRRVWRWMRRQDPLQIHVETDPEIIYANMPDWITFPQFVPVDSAEIPPPPRNTLAMSAWAKQLGGAPAHSVDLQVTLKAWDDLEVIVDMFRVEARGRDLPPGSVVVQPVGGASIQRAELDVELSTFACTVTPRKAGSAEPFDGFAFQLKPGEVQRFLLHVHAPYGGSEPVDAYEWKGLLDLLIQNKRRTVEINDNGGPFVLVNAHRYRELWWMDGQWKESHLR